MHVTFSFAFSSNYAKTRISNEGAENAGVENARATKYGKRSEQEVKVI